jgi:hypothetical protein
MCVVVVAVTLLLGSVSSAATIHWTGLGDDNLWSNPANWEGNKVPTSADEAYVDVPAAAAPNGPVIQDGIDAKALGLGCEVAGEPTMTMTGGTLEIADWIWWGDGAACHGTFTMSGGTITVTNEHELGWGGGSGTWIMTGGTVNAGELVIPTATGLAGQLYLHGGTFNVGSDGLSMTGTGLIDITEGALVLEGDQRATIEGFISAGQITAYDGAGYFELDYDERNPGKTTLTAAPITEKAYKPSPPDGAKNVTAPLLQWRAGMGAAFHDVYFGTNPTLGPADFRGRQTFTTYWHVPGLIPGTTYYWRVDEVEIDGVTIHKGDVWSFTAAPLTAYDPVPRDGAKWIATDSDLSWSAGATAIKHDVYFGTDQAAVANGTGGTLKSSQQTTKTYDPGAMAQDTTYYWRIDEYDSGGAKYPGKVFSFTTIGANAGIRGYYFKNMNLTGAAAMVRIDPAINFNWAGGGPGAPIGIDQFSVRWAGAVEALYSEPYRFEGRTDDGYRMWLDGKLIIDAWWDQSATSHLSAPINLVAGQLYGVRVEFYESGGDAVAQLYWQSPSMPRQIVPAGALQLPLRASSPNPPNGAVDVKHTPTLRWSTGEKAAKHNVYFGTDATAVDNATTASAGIYRGQQDLKANSYVPSEAPLEWNKTYYWRIDEVNAADTWKSNVWSFTTANFIVVDDFEDYTDDVGSRIFQTWRDGFGFTEPAPGYPGNGSGSAVGYAQAPFAEQTIVHGGSQSMPLAYDNSGTGGKTRYSETQREWASPQDWTINNVKALTLYFYGASANAAEQLYVALEDNAGHVKIVNYSDIGAVQIAAWQEWNIELTQFSAAGVNLAAVKKMYIGLGNRTSPRAGGTGTIFIDDIRVYPSRCVPSMGKPAADLSGNCVVDYADLDIMANTWLDSGAQLVADLDADSDVDFTDYAKLADAWLDELLWP